MTSTGKVLEGVNNIKLFYYDYPHKDYKSLITGRNTYLDSLVESEHINCVLSVFGPMKWIPRCPHLCGFALSQVVIPESPYFQRMSAKGRFIWSLKRFFLKELFGRSTVLYTENKIITDRVQRLFPNKKVSTITNYYNQVYDRPERWKEHLLPAFSGKTFMTLASPYPHKNLEIAKDIATYLKEKYPSFSFRFVLSIEEKDYPHLDESLKKHFCFVGKLDIEECPSVYKQSDIVFQPTLLECFTAAYPEAMRMERPIVTTDLAFARGLCGDAAEYYSPLSAKEAAESLYHVSNNYTYAESLIKNGREQLKRFDNYTERVNKLIAICESLV